MKDMYELSPGQIVSAEAFIERQLWLASYFWESGGPLARALEGRRVVRAFAPSAVPMEKPSDFDQGGQWERDDSDALTEFVEGWLERDPARVMVLEDSVYEWPAAGEAGPGFHLGPITYWAARFPASQDELAAQLKQHSRYPGIGVLTTGAELAIVEAPGADAVVSEQQVVELAQRATAILVRAWDAKDYLVGILGAP